MNTGTTIVFVITGGIVAILLFAAGPIVMHQALACDVMAVELTSMGAAAFTPMVVAGL